MSLPAYLEEAWLGRVSFSRDPEWDWGETEGLRYAVESHTRAEISHDREHAQATLHAEIVWHRGEEQVEGPFELKVEVGSRFALTEPEATDEEIEGWVAFNSQHLLWPYLRGYVSMVTAASGLPALTLYTVTVPNPRVGSDDLDEDSAIEPDPVPPELTQ